MSQFKKIHLGHAVAQHHKKRGACASGGFYTSPTAAQTVSSSDPLTISWDTTCMSTKAVDIYLYAPGAGNPRIHLWETVDFASGTYQTQLHPKWWNSTSSVNLQLAIVEGGTLPFLATLPAGPVFTATYSAPANGSVPVEADTSIPESSVQVVNNVSTKHGPTGGKLAAAVIIPLLVIIALCVGAYIRFSRQKNKEARNRFSQAIDKRMSVIAPEWNSVSVAGAQAAIRQSMAVGEGGTRFSSFSFGNGIRPDSTVALEGGQAGIGTKGLQSGIDVTTPQMTELRSGPRTAVLTGERVSRVSFAADTRPSGESRRSAYNTRTSRAFHVGHVPPVPTLQDSGELSPTQRAGPLTLSAADITARISGLETAPRASVDEVMPALTMMRTGMKSSDDLLLIPKSETPPPLPSPPPRAHQPQTSVVGHMPMQPMPASVMSPDEMLRAYAERRAMASPPPAVSAPAPVHYDGHGMRTLYSPTTPMSGAMLITPDVLYGDMRQSAAPSERSRYDDENDAAYVQ
ncbi:hypothetical protein BC835DRAFT_1262903 [Cytidiella melzeri]|nr:hypothetical protein BC835DRAFT_1262903 [Cytidiella melzeri]